jgi:manganese transport system permease protein
MMNAIVQWFAEPLQYEFMVKAVAVSAFVGLVCAVLSCYMTLKGWALMGDAVSHSVTPGVVLAHIFHLPFALGAFVFGVGSVLAIGYIQSKTRIKEDTVIGLVFTGFFAFGLVLISKTPSNVDFLHILFGNVLGLPNSDIIQTFVIGIITLIGILVLRKDLLLFCFDPTHARSIGLNTTALYYTLLTLLSLTIVVALQAVGIILVVAMLITPGAIAYLLTDRFDRMMVLAVISGVSCSVLGTYLSYHLDASTGGCIVVLQTLLFVVTMLLAPKHGLLLRGKRGAVS